MTLNHEQADTRLDPIARDRLASDAAEARLEETLEDGTDAEIAAAARHARALGIPLRGRKWQRIEHIAQRHGDFEALADAVEAEDATATAAAWQRLQALWPRDIKPEHQVQGQTALRTVGRHERVAFRLTPHPDPTLADDLTRTADELDAVDADAAERLKALSKAIAGDGDATDWAAVDVRLAINPAHLADTLRQQPFEDGALGRMEQLRNVLVLVPVLLTWFSLFVAGLGYSAAVQADRTLITEPFLLLWEEGFRGHLTAPLSWLTLSRAALADVSVLVVVAGLSWYIHAELNVKQARRERRAHALERQLHHLAWRASRSLQVPSNIGEYLDIFRRSADALLDELTAERLTARQATLARERETADWLRISEDLRGSTAHLSRLDAALEHHTSVFTDVAATLTDAAVSIGREEKRVADRSGEIAGAVKELNSDQKAFVSRMEETSRALDLRIAEVAAAVGTVGQPVRLMADQVATLREALETEQSAYSETAATAREAAAVLESAIQASADIVRTLGRGAGALQQVLDRTHTLPAALEKAASGQSAAADRLTAAAERLDRARDDADRALSAATMLLQQSVQSLETAARGLQPIGGSVSNLRDCTAELRAVLIALQPAVNDLPSVVTLVGADMKAAAGSLIAAVDLSSALLRGAVGQGGSTRDSGDAG